MKKTADPPAAVQTAMRALDRGHQVPQRIGGKRPVDPPDLNVYEQAEPAHQNRLLLDWLSDDAHRAELFRLVNDRGGVLDFPSRDASPRERSDLGPGDERPAPVTKHKVVRLVTARATLAQILRDDGTHFSNRVYGELGGGSFMLALDPVASEAHDTQRVAFRDAFTNSEARLVHLSHFAVRAASVMSLRAPEFDLAAFAEQSALRFCQKLMGYALRDFRLLETSLHDAYRGLVYQVFGRHFASDPMAIPLARQGMGKLLKRTSELIDAYVLDDEDGLKGCEDRAIPPGMIPSLKRLGVLPGDLNGEQRAIVALGAAVGTVGNVQAAACIAVKAMFDDKKLWQEARKLIASKKESSSRPTENYAEWKGLIEGALARNPPIPFLPRWRVGADGKPGYEVVLALGGGTNGAGAQGGDDPLIWGLSPAGPHHCAGAALAWPLIVEIVRQVILLPGLAERLDAKDANPMGLDKKWGFICESYPLVHRRERRVAQASLNVAMRLKAPVRDSADRVLDVIRAGAPRIEEALRESQHVHFAWFELIEADTVLVLHTVYDGPFKAYIQDFALKVGEVFDALFACIEDAPPSPVDKFPDEFVAHLQRYNRAPAMGYFFSAYPRSEVAQLIRDNRVLP
ncbi:MAG: cytochrome P450 [Pseudomonadota bacterium]|nr:hypothetical protein [Burkholderiaceae bacterium]MDQ3447390.1 cytochrome P450 [Pseudomonadota bacterium]